MQTLLDLDQLRTFLLIAETGSFTKTGGRGFNSRQLHHLTVQRRSLKSSERLFSL